MSSTPGTGYTCADRVPAILRAIGEDPTAHGPVRGATKNGITGAPSEATVRFGRGSLCPPAEGAPAHATKPPRSWTRRLPPAVTPSRAKRMWRVVRYAPALANRACRSRRRVHGRSTSTRLFNGNSLASRRRLAVFRRRCRASQPSEHPRVPCQRTELIVALAVGRISLIVASSMMWRLRQAAAAIA